jgi:RNA ligase (TIGR02306 family)
MGNNLAQVGTITDIKPIDGADKIVQAIVSCGNNAQWSGVVQKNTMNCGDKVVVFLMDAILPKDDRWSFLEKQGWRVSMMRLRGVPSECVIIPYAGIASDGDFVGNEFGVTKYDKPIPMQSNINILGHFPIHVSKTDEPNAQGAQEIVNALHGKPYSITQKVDGTSFTAWKDDDGKCHIASRSYELDIKNCGFYSEMFAKYDLARILENGLTIQAEIAGIGIQNNPMGLPDRQIFVFNAFKNNKELDCNALGIQTVKTIEKGNSFGYSIDDLRTLANHRYDNGHLAEGIVVRATNGYFNNGKRISFKVINLDYK